MTKRPRHPFLAIGIAALGLLATPTSSSAADTPELKALKTALAGVAPNAADDTQLANAVAAAIQANPKLRPGRIAGEALKAAGVNTTNPGAAIADATDQLGLDPVKYIADAAVRASTGKAANADFVPDFTAFLLGDGTDNIAIAAAKVALKSKSTLAAGAIIGGRASDYLTDTAKISFSNTAISQGLKPAITAIALFGSETVDDPGAYAVGLATPNVASVLGIAKGVTSSNPDEADDIVDQLLASSAGPKTRALAPKVAKTVGLAATIEQVQLLSETMGAVVNKKQVKSTAKALVQAISARVPADAGAQLSLVNKADEVGEVIAYYVAALKTANTATSGIFTNPQAAAKLVFSIAQTMFKAAKVKTIRSIGQTSVDLKDQLIVKDGNFAASLAYTLTRMGLTPDVLAAIKARLTSSAASKIGGARYKAKLIEGFNAGFGDLTGAGGYEDGTGTTPGTGNVVDPETDIRNG
jgi:hypothetical protein